MLELLRNVAARMMIAGFLVLLATAGGRAEEADYILHSFGQGTDGVDPQYALIEVGGVFYGTTINGGINGAGTIYSITPQGVEKVLYSFGSQPGDGGEPYCALTYVKGVFYGTTNHGGANNQGTVFSFVPGGSETVLYSFTGGSDGREPANELLYFAGDLYGIAGGGSSSDGIIFKITLDGTKTIVHDFAGGLGDGEYPSGGLISSGGVLYGLTAIGGTANNGTVYALTGAGSYRVIYSFQGGKEDGSYPSGELLDVGGTLYGTTRQAGFYGLGTVFTVTQAGAEQVIHSFGSTQGQRTPPGAGEVPYAGLIEVGGLLYGTTFQGGNYNSGVVFSMTLQGVDTVVHSALGGVDGSRVYAGLKSGGTALYGVRSSAGAYNQGVVFRLIMPKN